MDLTSCMISSYEGKRRLGRSKGRWAIDKICKVQVICRVLYSCDSGSDL